MENEDYFISVVIPNYNYERYVGEAIESALGQTYDHREIIVVDDGSTDNSVKVIKSFGDKVRLIKQENQHASAARNTGIGASRGKWIAFLDSDDQWHPQKLEFQIEALKRHPEWSYIGTHALEGGAYPDFDTVAPKERETSLMDFFCYTPLSDSDALIKKECFENVGVFNPELRGSEDLDLWLRIASTYKGGIIEAPLWRYRQHPAQLNRNIETMLSTRKQVISQFFNTHNIPLSQRRIAWGQYLYDAAITHRDNGGSLWRSLVYGLGSLLYAPDSYHAKATAVERLKSEVVTLMRLLRIQKPGAPSR